MGFLNDSRATVRDYELRAADRIEKCPPTVYRHGSFDAGNFRVIGTCGHILTVILPRDVALWEDRIATKRRHRRRCTYCPK